MSATTRRRPKTSTSRDERRAKVDALHNRLEEFASSLDDAERELFEARFDHYSPRNALLIVMQDPAATVVRGFYAWHDEGRKVRKGGHGIGIFAPAGAIPVDGQYVTNEAGEQVQATRPLFKVTYVFDVSQTDPIDTEE